MLGEEDIRNRSAIQESDCQEENEETVIHDE
jgi:hypothetical protein